MCRWRTSRISKVFKFRARFLPSANDLSSEPASRGAWLPVDEGAIYYSESRERVRIVLDEALRTAAQAAVSDLRLRVCQSRIPPPLKDSPKCPRCALVTICLPDEVAG